MGQQKHKSPKPLVSTTPQQTKGADMPVQTADQKLAAIAAIIVGSAPVANAGAPGGVPVGPGITPMPTETRWWRNPGTPITTDQPAAYGDVETCKRYAANGYGPAGTRTLALQDLETTLVLCDKIGADDITSAGQEALVEHAGDSDTQTVIFALLAGWSQGGAAGRPSLFIGAQKIADLCKTPGPQPVWQNPGA